MRIAVVVFSSAWIAIAAVCGCAPPRFAAQEQPVSQPYGPPTPSAYERSVEAVRGSTAKLTSWARPEPRQQTPEDELSLSRRPGQVSPGLHISMGKLMEKQGEPGRAEQHYRDGLEHSPSDEGLLLALAHLLDRQGRFEEAIEGYLESIKHSPQSARAHNDLGLCFARQQRLNESLAALATAVRLEPDKPLYRNNIATVLVEADRPQEAWQHLQAVHPPAVAHYNMGFLLVKKGDHPAAYRHFSRSAEIDPTLTAARQWADRLHAHAAPRQESDGPRLGAPEGGPAVSQSPRHPPQDAATADRRYESYYQQRAAEQAAGDRYYRPQ